MHHPVMTGSGHKGEANRMRIVHMLYTLSNLQTGWFISSHHSHYEPKWHLEATLCHLFRPSIQTALDTALLLHREHADLGIFKA